MLKGNIVLLILSLMLQRVSNNEDFQHIGCYLDKGSDRTMLIRFWPASSSTTPALQIIRRCAEAAEKKGYVVFGVQNRGTCRSGPYADIYYNKHGPATNCFKGLGGPWANDVYIFKKNVCRDVIFEDTLRTQHKTLSNHSLAKHLVKDGDSCRIQCFLNHDCVSYNLGPSSTPGMLLCELNNADRYQYPDDYQDKPGFSYTGTKNDCISSPCLHGATCKNGYGGVGFRCVCPVGFRGDHCRK